MLRRPPPHSNPNSPAPFGHTGICANATAAGNLAPQKQKQIGKTRGTCTAWQRREPFPSSPDCEPGPPRTYTAHSQCRSDLLTFAEDQKPAALRNTGIWAQNSENRQLFKHDRPSHELTQDGDGEPAGSANAPGWTARGIEPRRSKIHGVRQLFSCEKCEG